MNTKIEFVNHASIIIYGDNVSILCDPWFEGPAFDNGWNLLVETPDSYVKEILSRISHIWISHEHPDHFSISFFLKYGDLIRSQKISILFQKTQDKRVINFLKLKHFSYTELIHKKKVLLSSDFEIMCLKDGFYDSALFVINKGEKILNLNDCEISSSSKLNDLFRITGNVDVLLTQFSYAAWKGGKANIDWRKSAAQKKLDTIVKQAEKLSPRFLIPFASFIYFSHELNFYLNDSINTPESVMYLKSKRDININFMKPGDVIGGEISNDTNEAIIFWMDKYKKINNFSLNKIKTIQENKIEDAFTSYKSRIRESNNFFMMNFLRKFLPLKVFRPVIIRIIDLNISYKLDLFADRLNRTEEVPAISMSSGSLYFLLKNSFGFDTLTINGCFEELQKNAFIDSSKTLAIENLNNLGIYVNFGLILKMKIVFLFLRRLRKVRRNLYAQ